MQASSERSRQANSCEIWGAGGGSLGGRGRGGAAAHAAAAGFALACPTRKKESESEHRVMSCVRKLCNPKSAAAKKLAKFEWCR